MAAARRRGERVVVVTATAGEHGTADPDRWPPERLGRATRARAADQPRRPRRARATSCSAIPTAVARNTTARHASSTIIDDVRPDTIVTFGPEGMTGHPDHRAVSRWTTDAWQAAGRERSALVRHPDPRLPHRMGRDQRAGRPLGRRRAAAVRRRGRPRPRRPAGRAPARPQGRRRSRAHASQTAPLRALVGDDRFRAWWRTEWFVDAFTHSRLADRYRTRSTP